MAGYSFFTNDLNYFDPLYGVQGIYCMNSFVLGEDKFICAEQLGRQRLYIGGFWCADR